MAEHLRNEMARAGLPVRPSRIVTLAHFIEPRTRFAPPPEGVLHLLIEQALEKLKPPSFAAVSGFRGFHRALAALMEETPLDAAPGTFGPDLARLSRSVEAGLAARGMALRNTRLRSVDCSGDFPAQVVMDGFFSLSPAELDLVAAFAARAQVILTLPDWPGAAAARRRILAAGFSEERHEGTRRRPERSAFSTPTLEHETEEIARRILDHAARGRAFREIGIILRTRDPYGPALETTLARFGIPARFYFTAPLADHPVVRYLSGIVRALLGGWDHEAILTLLRMPISGVGATPEGDRFDFDLRKKLPGTGLQSGLGGAGSQPAASRLVSTLGRLAELDPWRKDRLDVSGWASRLKTLRSLLPNPQITGEVSRDQVQIWRSAAAALDAFDAAADQAAAALAGDERITLAHFWRQLDLTLALEPLRIPDRRRNVVHVMDVFEARQWELPVVFVCGLVERHFPQYHREDPLLNDAARRSAGLPASLDRQAEERFLFEIATTRPTGELVLSYARFNEKGEETLPSFFLEGTEIPACETRVRPRPRPMATGRTRSAEAPSGTRERLTQIHQTLAPTAIESFLQCPFQFFAARTLRPRARPPAPRDRLDVMLQGSILHRALAELTRFPLLGAGVFDQVFADEIRRARVPANYRTEAVRLEMLRHFEGYLADRQVALGWTSRVEEEFSFPLNPSLTIRGRIDRLDAGPHGEALVIDYKYSAGEKIRERVEENASGHKVQGGLYLLAARRAFQLDPAGMLYCGLRNEVVWDGWHLPIPGIEAIGESGTRAFLEELMQAAVDTAAQTFEAILSGRIAPQPADIEQCKWCDYRDICRVETAAAAAGAGSA